MSTAQPPKPHTEAQRERIIERTRPTEDGGTEVIREITREPLVSVPADADLPALLSAMEGALPGHALERYRALKREHIAEREETRYFDLKAAYTLGVWTGTVHERLAPMLAAKAAAANTPPAEEPDPMADLARRSRTAPGTLLDRAELRRVDGRSLRARPGRRHGEPDGVRSLGRVSVPGTTRTRAIVQLPAEDAAAMRGNSLVYGYSLRTLMSAGGASRRGALGCIVGGQVSPHDPLDVARWAAQRAGETDLVAGIERLQHRARQHRENIDREGIDLRASVIEMAPYREPAAAGHPGPEAWQAIGEAVDAIADLAAVHRAELAGMLASGDLEGLRAWVQHHHRAALAAAEQEASGAC